MHEGLRKNVIGEREWGGGVWYLMSHETCAKVGRVAGHENWAMGKP